jgi:hypothetical protein
MTKRVFETLTNDGNPRSQPNQEITVRKSCVSACSVLTARFFAGRYCDADAVDLFQYEGEDREGGHKRLD